MESYRVGGTTDLSKWDFEELPGIKYMVSKAEKEWKDNYGI